MARMASAVAKRVALCRKAVGGCCGNILRGVGVRWDVAAVADAVAVVEAEIQRVGRGNADGWETLRARWWLLAGRWAGPWGGGTRAGRRCVEASCASEIGVPVASMAAAAEEVEAVEVAVAALGVAVSVAVVVWEPLLSWALSESPNTAGAWGCRPWGGCRRSRRSTRRRWCP